MNLIDLSCHFLDGTDCGPTSFAESLDMCRTAVAEGVQTIALTPRWKSESLEPPLPLTCCQEKIERLQKEVGPALDLKLGFVLQFSAELPNLVERYGNLLALGGRKHLLVSLPANNIPTTAENIWSALSQRGFVVVISQPECRPALRRQPERIQTWISNGVKLQINAASVIGVHGREVNRFAMNCLESYEDSVFLASNAHPGNGYMASLKKANEELRRVFGDRRTRKYLRDLPAAIVGNEEAPLGRTAHQTVTEFSFLRAFTSF